MQLDPQPTDCQQTRDGAGDLSFLSARGLGVHVNAMATTRFGGVSQVPYSTFNLGSHVGDDPLSVQTNRQRLRQALPGDPVWLNQVHGTIVFDADAVLPERSDSAVVPTADAAVTTAVGRVLAVLTADCMPVVLASECGEVVGIAHAGWRGLADGVLVQTVQAMRNKCREPVKINAWIGPCIGPGAFQVGPEVRERFIDAATELSKCFAVDPAVTGRWLADLPAIATWQLGQLGIEHVHWCGLCTVTDLQHRFYSYRREAQTGRMATLVWINHRGK